MHESNSRTILIVDDQPHVRALLRNSLARHGYRVLLAVDEESAVATARLHKIDVALVDIELPGRHGGEVAVRLRRLGVKKTVFITGLDPDILIAEGLVDAAAPLVRKPFTLAVITGAVEEVLGSAEPAVSLPLSPIRA